MSVMHLPQKVIETRHLYKRFGEVTALEDINLHIARGEFVAVMGASGSGKTTLMNILTCLDTASEGQVLLDGTDAAALDEENEQRVLALLQHLHQQGRTIVLVTHNPALGHVADRIIRLQHGKYLGEENNQHAMA